jgi:RNase P subunit RPR2
MRAQVKAAVLKRRFCSHCQTALMTRLTAATRKPRLKANGNNIGMLYQGIMRRRTAYLP